MPSKSHSDTTEVKADPGAGTLVLIGTPLGNRGDLSERARKAAFGADLLLCEDTRSPQRLFSDEPDSCLPRRVSCFVGNEHQRIELMLKLLREGKTVAFLSEAGMPVWSDPGRLLVEAAVEAGFDVDAVPGPTAGTTALALSGFSATGACFMGFVPRSGKERQAQLARIAAHEGTCILYEAGNRTPRLLTDLAASVPSPDIRRALVARELTKKHQELLRGTLGGLAEKHREPLRGEVTVVVEGPSAATDRLDAKPLQGPAAESVAREVLDIVLDSSLKPRARARALATLTGQDARELYARLSASRPERSSEE